jgi:hypothetical protein
MHKNAMKCNKTLSKCCKNKHGASKIIDTFETYQGLHRQAQFKDLGDNRFVVRFSSEGDWYRALHNGPWQFDFNINLLKDYNGSVRPSDIVFDMVDIWISVLDLPMDMMNRVYGEIIGAWVGKFIRVEVDEEGLAWGKDLCIRVALQVDQPLV